MKQMFIHHPFQVGESAPICVVASLQAIKVGMNGLCPLLPHHPKPNMPLSEPRDNMFLQHVHLREDGGGGEGLSVTRHELFDGCV